ncbi:MAG: VCBS repeat-containing protein [Myxococcales bacterium]|nr:VCBS repeat-containing protein [Myxococcales bacterium]
MDVITANSNGNNLSLRLGMGNGTFGTASPLSAGSSPIFVTTADWNADGKPDLGVVNNGITTGTYVVSILMGDGAGGFGASTNIDIGNTAVPRGAVVKDFNLDGKPDLAVAGYGNNTIPVLLGKGDGTFEPVISLSGPANPQSIDSADFNGDGWPDLVATTSLTTSQNVSVMLGSCK